MGGLPDGALVALPSAHQHNHPVVLVPQLACKRHAGAHGQPVASDPVASSTPGTAAGLGCSEAVHRHLKVASQSSGK